MITDDEWQHPLHPGHLVPSWETSVADAFFLPAITAITGRSFQTTKKKVSQ